MTKVTHNLGIKVTCIFLVMITGITAFFSIVGILFAGESGIFSDQKNPIMIRLGAKTPPTVIPITWCAGI